MRKTLVDLPDDPRVIINDGIAVSDGVIFGTKDLAFKQPIAALYHYATSQQVMLREICGGQTCSNGKYFHDDRLIDIDTRPKTITEYRYRPRWPARAPAADQRTPIDVFPPSRTDSGPHPTGSSIMVAFYNGANVADGLAQPDPHRRRRGVAQRIIPGSPRVTCHAFITFEWQNAAAVHHSGGRHAGGDPRDRARSGHAVYCGLPLAA